LPTFRCAVPRKNRFPKQYVVERILARFVLVPDDGEKKLVNNGIEQINTEPSIS